MAAPTEIYVDPSIAANSGAGTIGSPYGDLQYALNTATPDTTNGNRINIKAGSAEVLAASLTLATWGSPTNARPLIFQGYTAAAGDGGVGVINCNSVAMLASTSYQHVVFKGLECYGSGSANLLSINSYCIVEDCYIHTTTGAGIVMAGTAPRVTGTRVENVAGIGIDNNSASGSVIVCYLKNGANSFDAAIRLLATGANAIGNIVSVSGASDGIRPTFGSSVIGNSILSAGGTGKGIVDAGSGRYWWDAINNLIEGFSGVGGVGIQCANDPRMVVGNALFNCATSLSTGDLLIASDNETLVASPFDKSGAGTFANRFVYFSPAATGNVRGGSYGGGGRLDKGAVQHVDAGGGSGGGLILSRGFRGGYT